MAKVDIDSMFEPIEFTLEKKEYKLDKIDPDLIDKVNSVDKTDSVKCVIEQFALLTGIPEDEARRIDIRKIKATIEYIMKSISSESKEKNV